MLNNTDSPTDAEIISAVDKYTTHTFLTVSRKAADHVNSLVLAHIGESHQKLAHIQYDCDCPPLPLYIGTKVMITQNRAKKDNVVNVQVATLHMHHRQTIFLKLPNGNIVNSCPVSISGSDSQTQTVYPFMPAYAITRHKGRHFRMPNVWFDVDHVPTGTGYVAVSRVKSLSNILFFSPLKTSHFRPNNYSV